MKIVVVGDIHGRTVWKDILDKEQPDRVVFLGDYVSTHDYVSSDQQISNLLDILRLKEANPDRVTLLRGNHDIQHLGYWWAVCCDLDTNVLQFMSTPDCRERFLADTSWVSEFSIESEKVVCSHAGISKVWMEQNNLLELDDINQTPPSVVFSFIPASFFDSDGSSITQGCTWIRPSALTECHIDGYTQIVGHTKFKKIYRHQIKGSDNSLWFCDTLHIPAYLVIENGMFQPKILNVV